MDYYCLNVTLKACSVLHVFGFMVQDILKRMVLFCKAAVEVHWLNAHMYRVR